jgi:hypothetical protein
VLRLSPLLTRPARSRTRIYTACCMLSNILRGSSSPATYGRYVIPQSTTYRSAMPRKPRRVGNAQCSQPSERRSRSRSPLLGDGRQQSSQRRNNQYRDETRPNDSHRQNYRNRNDHHAQPNRSNDSYRPNYRGADERYREERTKASPSTASYRPPPNRADLNRPSDRSLELQRHDRCDTYEGYDGYDNHVPHRGGPGGLNTNRTSNSHQLALFSSSSQTMLPRQRVSGPTLPSAASIHCASNRFQSFPSGNNAPLDAYSRDTKPSSAFRDKDGQKAAKPPFQTKRRTGLLSIKPPTAPVPSEAYLAKASEPSQKLSSPADLLIILDLNGTLLCRKKGKNAQGSISPNIRPGLREFLSYLFTSFKVMIWTSARPENAQRMVQAAFLQEEQQKLLAIWGRDTLGLTSAQYNAKVQVYKTLERVWKGEFMIYHPNQPDQIVFDQTNTVLFDDSTEKAVAHPFNLVNIPEYTATIFQTKNDTALQQCIEYLEDVKWQSNVSAYMRQYPFECLDPKEREDRIP